jgi:pimeloyl-ACP methyl ester carboxylesterase
MRLLVLASLLLLIGLPLVAASVDGVPIHFTSTGKGPRTVMFVHGWTCDETTWADQVPALAKEFRVITVDLPGHGKSPLPADGKLSMELFARAVEAVRAEANASPVVLVGHSMGTPVIIQHALTYPKTVAAMVFVDGLVSMGNRKGPGPTLDGPEGTRAREAMVKGMASKAMAPGVEDKVMKMMMAPPGATATGAMNAMLEPADWREATLAMPILGLYAEKSNLGNRAYIKAHFPNLEYNELPGTSHFLMMEKPEDFNRALVLFLNKQKF